MSSPKHLWSGNWEDESQTAQSSLPAPPPPREPLPPPEPPPSPPSHLRRLVVLTVLAALVLVGVVWAITSSGSNTKGHSSATTTSAAQQTPTSPAPRAPTATIPGTSPPPPTGTATGPTTTASAAESLGLQLALVPVNRVIVQAVVPGSAAAQVGIGAGALLLTINGMHVSSPGQANAILAKLPKGSRVTLQLVQGPAQIQATIQESNGP
jgi:S1-C subfamily serine protease